MQHKWILVRFTIGLVLLGCLGFGDAETQAQEKEVRKYAVLVGVRDYDRNQLRSLPYPENDVQELAEVLKSSGFRRVELLTQTAGAKQSRYLPMAKTIREALKGMLEDRSEGDLVLVAFAGHGVQFKGEKEHYFCPMDAVLTDKSSLISLTEVYQQLAESKAGAKLLLVDACRNDPLSGNSRDGGDVRLDSVTRPQLPDPPGGVAALFSCSAGQKAFEDESLKHGVFFHHVLLGLKGDAKLKNRDTVTWDGLVAYVKVEVPDTVKDLFGNSIRQIPEHKGELRGQVTIIGAATASVPVRPVPTIPIPNPSPGGFAGTTAGEVKVLPSGIKLRWCPPGEFTMGSPVGEKNRGDDENQVQVTLTSGFWLGETEVTQGQWESLMHSTPWKGKKVSVVEGIEYAASYISHGDAGDGKLEAESAVDFCRRLTDQERKAGRLPSDWKYSLPTDAQWEYACRAGTNFRYSFGDDESKLSEYAWWGSAIGDGNAKTEKYPHKVAQKPANAWGLRDMHGNVWEWCSDWYDTKLAGGTNPEGPTTGTYRVLRGGSWHGNASYCRSASRIRFSPGRWSTEQGLRVAGVPSSE